MTARSITAVFSERPKDTFTNLSLKRNQDPSSATVYSAKQKIEIPLSSLHKNKIMEMLWVTSYDIVHNEGDPKISSTDIVSLFRFHQKLGDKGKTFFGMHKSFINYIRFHVFLHQM